MEITGEISVCGRACLSSRGSRGKGVGFEGREKTEKERKKENHALQYCCVVCGVHSSLCVSGDNLFSTGPFIQGLSAGVRQDGK